MCETRNDNRTAIRARREQEDGPTRQPRPPRSFNRRGGPPRIHDDEWVLVRRQPGRSNNTRRPRRQETTQEVEKEE